MKSPPPLRQQSQDSCPRVPQYTQDEVDRAIKVLKLLIKVRDRCLSQGIKPY